jgi:hypothetical protein
MLAVYKKNPFVRGMVGGTLTEGLWPKGIP